MTIAMLAVIAPVSLGLPKVYQDWRGEPTAAVVTKDADGTSRPGVEQTIEVKRAADGEPLGRLNTRDDRDLRVGDQVTVLVDPAGWFEPDSGQQPPFRARVAAYSLAGGGLTLVILLTVARTARDLRRWRRAGRSPGSEPGAARQGSPTEKPGTDLDTPRTGKATVRAASSGQGAAGRTAAGRTTNRGNGRGAKKAAAGQRRSPDAAGGSQRRRRPADPDDVTDVLESAERATWGSDGDGDGGGSGDGGGGGD